MAERRLPVGLLPRGLSRKEAAAYIGLPEARFVKAVEDGKMPNPFYTIAGARQLWDRMALDRALDVLMDGVSQPRHDSDPLMDAL